MTEEKIDVKIPIRLTPQEYAAAIDANPTQEDLDRGTPKRPVYLTTLAIEGRGNPMMAFNHVHLLSGTDKPSTCVKYRWGEPGRCPVAQHPVPSTDNPTAVEEWLDED